MQFQGCTKTRDAPMAWQHQPGLWNLACKRDHSGWQEQGRHAITATTMDCRSYYGVRSLRSCSALPRGNDGPVAMWPGCRARSFSFKGACTKTKSLSLMLTNQECPGRRTSQSFHLLPELTVPITLADTHAPQNSRHFWNASWTRLLVSPTRPGIRYKVNTYTNKRAVCS